MSLREDIFWYGMWLILATVFVVTIAYGVDSIREWQAAVKHTEASTGCEYVGSPKGANGVGFFDCNGVIETKRIK